jgi:hypothetical protein
MGDEYVDTFEVGRGAQPAETFQNNVVGPRL